VKVGTGGVWYILQSPVGKNGKKGIINKENNGESLVLWVVVEFDSAGFCGWE